MADGGFEPYAADGVQWVWVCLGFSDEMFEGFVEVFTDEAKARRFAAEEQHDDEGLEWQVTRTILIR